MSDHTILNYLQDMSLRGDDRAKLLLSEWETKDVSEKTPRYPIDMPLFEVAQLTWDAAPLELRELLMRGNMFVTSLTVKHGERTINICYRCELRVTWSCEQGGYIEHG